MRQHLFSSLIIVLASLLPIGTYGAPFEKDNEQPEDYSRLTAYADSCMEQFDLFPCHADLQ